MTQEETHEFRQRVLESTELRQKLKDTDLLPPALRRQATIEIAQGEGFHLDGPGADRVLAAIEHLHHKWALPIEPLRPRAE